MGETGSSKAVFVSYEDMYVCIYYGVTFKFRLECCISLWSDPVVCGTDHDDQMVHNHMYCILTLAISCERWKKCSGGGVPDRMRLKGIGRCRMVEKTELVIELVQ